MRVIVRNYRDEDRENCRSLWRELTEWHRGIYQDPRIGGEHPEDYFDKHLAKVGPDKLWVAVHNSKVVGLVGLFVEGDEAEIEPLIVSKTYRGKGIGRQLLETVISEAKKMGIRFLCIKPVARNVKTIKFLYEQVSKRWEKSNFSWTFQITNGSLDLSFSDANLTIRQSLLPLLNYMLDFDAFSL